MQVVWEADTAAFASRKRAARACISCQKKKKRCHHTFTRAPDQQAESDGLDRVLPTLTHKEPVRFVGDLNPESILTDLSSRSKGTNRISRIGTWVEQSQAPPDEMQIRYAEPPTTKNGEKVPVNVEKYGKSEGGRRTLTTHHRNYLQAVGAFRVLPKESQTAMIATYISCIDGLLPILCGTKLLQDYSAGKTSIFLIQAICLVTCKIPDVAQFLRLYEDGPLLDPIPFSRSLHIGLDAAMKADLEPDRMTKVQILTLMHLHNDGPGGIEESSLHLSQAIHDAWTAGLHIQTPGRTTKDEASLLWWMIWTLDRINACIGGRPIMIADRDIDIPRPPLEANSQAPITVWIRLGDLLDQIIDFYRPTANPDASGWEIEFPSWNSMLEDVNLDNTAESHVIVLELCYNVIAILSCRNASRTHPAYHRRIHAANRIESLLSLPSSTHPDTIPPLSVPPIPLVPYAISLSLTVAYRGLRDHSSNAEATATALAMRCEMLESLSSRWWTADAMAKLGRKALRSMRDPVGVKRVEVMELEGQMEAEVTVCKYGPFDGRGREEQRHDTSTTTTAAAGDTTTGAGRGGALHLLSDAAAAHSQSQTHSHSHSQFHPSSLGHNTGTPNSLTLSHSHLPGTASGSTSRFHPTPLTDPLPTPGPHDTFPPTTASSNIPHSASTNTMDLPTTGQLDPAVFEKFDSAFSTTHTDGATGVPGAMGGGGAGNTFSDLDLLFDGFFDLSMPTVTFEDPMFGVVDMDFGMGVGDDVDVEGSFGGDGHGDRQDEGEGGAAGNGDGDVEGEGEGGEEGDEDAGGRQGEGDGEGQWISGGVGVSVGTGGSMGAVGHGGDRGNRTVMHAHGPTAAEAGHARTQSHSHSQYPELT